MIGFDQFDWFHGDGAWAKTPVADHQAIEPFPRMVEITEMIINSLKMIGENPGTGSLLTTIKSRNKNNGPKITFYIDGEIKEIMALKLHLRNETLIDPNIKYTVIVEWNGDVVEKVYFRKKQ